MWLPMLLSFFFLKLFLKFLVLFAALCWEFEGHGWSYDKASNWCTARAATLALIQAARGTAEAVESLKQSQQQSQEQMFLRPGHAQPCGNKFSNAGKMVPFTATGADAQQAT